MRTVILPGYSLKNKDWAYEVKNRLQEFDVEVVEWLHWNNENIKFDPQKEAERIASEVGDEGVNIIAKSLGTLVSCYLIPKIEVNKRSLLLHKKHSLASFAGKIIFCGIPLNDMNKNDHSQYKILEKFDNVIVFQNDKDIHGNCSQVKEFLEKINPKIKIIEKVGDTHEYPYYEDFKEFLT